MSGTSRANASRPACHWTHFPAGTLPSVERYTRGSFGLVENYPDYLLADVIRAGQREYLHFKGRHALPYCNVTHAFGIVAEDGGIVEALANGVWRHSIKEYRDTDTFIVQPRVAARERDACASLWESAVGTRYDYLDYVTDLVPLALIGRVVARPHHGNGPRRKSWICSGLPLIPVAPTRAEDDARHESISLQSSKAGPRFPLNA